MVLGMDSRIHHTETKRKTVFDLGKWSEQTFFCLILVDKTTIGNNKNNLI